MPIKVRVREEGGRWEVKGRAALRSIDKWRQLASGT